MSCLNLSSRQLALQSSSLQNSALEWVAHFSSRLETQTGCASSIALDGHGAVHHAVAELVSFLRFPSPICENVKVRTRHSRSLRVHCTVYAVHKFEQCILFCMKWSLRTARTRTRDLVTLHSRRTGAQGYTKTLFRSGFCSFRHFFGKIPFRIGCWTKLFKSDGVWKIGRFGSSSFKWRIESLILKNSPHGGPAPAPTPSPQFLASSLYTCTHRQCACVRVWAYHS